MGQVIKTTAILMSLFLFMLTMGGWVLRRSDPAERVPVLQQERPADAKSRLLQVWPGINTPLVLTPDYRADLRFMGVDTTGTNAYFFVQGADYTVMDFYRLSSAAPYVQPVIQNVIYEPSYLALATRGFAPATNWLLVALSNTDGTWAYWAVDVLTRRRINISTAILPYQLPYQSTNLITADGRWAVILSYDPANSHAEILRVDLQNGTSVNLTADYDQDGLYSLGQQVGQWILVEVDTQIFRLSLDGGTFDTLLPQPDGQSEYVALTDQPSGIVVISHGNEILGVEVNSQNVVWRYDELGFGFAQTGPDGWLFASHNHLPVRLHLPTGEIQPLPAPLNPATTFPIAESPDHTWLIYANRDAATGVMEWGRVNWVTHATHLIRRPMNDYYFAALSPDGSWLWLNSATGFYRLRVADGHLEYLLDGGPYTVAGWMRPFVRAWHPLPLLLIAGGLGLIGGLLHCRRK